MAQSPTSIKLTWLDNANNEEGFDLQRRVAGGSWAFIADLGDNTTQYVDQALAADTTYEYRIRSYAGNGTSDYSNVASATTPRYPELHMGEISGGGAVQFGTPPAISAWQAIVSVGVHDAYHEPVMGATVSGRWSNGASGDDSCVTDVSGYCAVVKPGLGPGTASVTYSVLGITYGSDPYLPGNNHDPNGSGSVFTVNRPVDAIYMPMIARP